MRKKIYVHDSELPKNLAYGQHRETAMQGRKTAMIVRMSDAQRNELLSWLRAQKTPVGLAERAWVMLLLADGQS